MRFVSSTWGMLKQLQTPYACGSQIIRISWMKHCNQLIGVTKSTFAAVESLREAKPIQF